MKQPFNNTNDLFSAKGSFNKAERLSWSSNYTTSSIKESNNGEEVAKLFALDSILQAIIYYFGVIFKVTTTPIMLQEVKDLIQLRWILTKLEKSKFNSLIKEFLTLFVTCHFDRLAINLEKYTIKLKDGAKLVCGHQKQMALHKMAILKLELNWLLEGRFVILITNT